MKNRNKILYWLFTALLCFGMLGSGISQLIHQKEMDAHNSHVGFPLYFLPLLGIWKILGVIVILLPNFKLLKEWAYAGFFFLMSGALFSHLAVGDSGKEIIGPLCQCIFVVLSWYFRPDDRKIILKKE